MFIWGIATSVLGNVNYLQLSSMSEKDYHIGTVHNVYSMKAVAVLHQGAPGQMTWLEDPPLWLKPWLYPA